MLCFDPIHEWVPVQFLSSDFCSHPKDMLRQLKDSEQQLWNLHAKQADSVDLWQGHTDTYWPSLVVLVYKHVCIHVFNLCILFISI